MAREIANRHWVDAFRDLVEDLGGEFRQFGSIVAFLGNIPLPFANGCLVLEPTNAEDIDAAITWVVSADVPYQIRVDEPLVPGLQATLDVHRLERYPAPMPAMVLPIGEIPRAAPEIRVDEVDESSYPAFVDVLVSTGIPAHFAEQIFPRRLIVNENAAYFLATLEGAVAGSSVAVRTGESGGVYSVATLEPARRRGVGTAVTWAAVAAMRDWGCTWAVLQSSEMGYSVYRAMGFEEVTRYIRFAPAEGDAELNRR
jgi:GNAT superfamily N-acetyltransferase